MTFNYSAPGFRSDGNGMLYGIGQNGYNWSFSVTESGAYRLGFFNSWLYSQDYNNRARGLPVRCLQE